MSFIKRMTTGLLLCAVLAGTVAPAAATGIVPVPTRDKGQTVYLRDTRVYPAGYNIADSNYFKLRDIGRLVDFGVVYDSASRTVRISSEAGYILEPSDPAEITDISRLGATAKITDQAIFIDGERMTPTVYQIDGNNYFKLRDLGKLVGFSVTYDSVTNRVTIDPDKPYAETEGYPTKWTAAMSEMVYELESNWDYQYQINTAQKHAVAVTGKAEATVTDVVAALCAVTSGAPMINYAMEESQPANTFWANQLELAYNQMHGIDTRPVYNGEDYASEADQNIFAGDEADVLRHDYNFMRSAYLVGGMEALKEQTLRSKLRTQTALIAQERTLLADAWTTAHATSEEIAAAKTHFAAELARIGRLQTDEDKVREVNALICDTYYYSLADKQEVSWVNAIPDARHAGKGLVCAYYTAAADWMLREVGITTFVARNRDHSWNNVLVDGKWYVFDGTHDGTDPNNGAEKWDKRTTRPLFHEDGSVTDGILGYASNMDFRDSSFETTRFMRQILSPDSTVGEE